MQRRVRRIVLIVVCVLLSLGLMAAALAVWLYQSGRLAAVATELIQRLAKQDVSIGAIQVTDWDTLLLTDVQLAQPLSGWRLTLDCPHIELHYGLRGLLNKRVERIAVRRPQIELSPQPDRQLTPTAPPSTALPFKRLLVEQGSVRLHWHQQTYSVHQLDARLQAQTGQYLHTEASGMLDGDATRLQLTATIDLQHPQTGGRLHLQTAAASLVRLTALLGQVVTLPFAISQGRLDLEVDVQLQAPTLQGVINATALQTALQVQDVALRQARLVTRTRFTADTDRQTWRLQGQAELQADQLVKSTDLTLQQVSAATDINLEAAPGTPHLEAAGEARLTVDGLQSGDLHLSAVTLTTPWQLATAAGGWQLTATPTLQSQRARLGAWLDATAVSLSHSTPLHLQMQSAAAALDVTATPELHVGMLQVKQTTPPLQITELHGRLPLHGQALRLRLSDADLQTRAWQRQGHATTPLLTKLRLHGSASLDLQQRHLTWQEVAATAPGLGRLHSSGAWQWPSHTLRDLQLQLVPDSIQALHTRLQPLLPFDDAGWQINGSGQLSLQASKLSLRAPWRLQQLTIDWQIRDGSFSSPDSTYAGEHVNGSLRANATLEAASNRYRLQGKLNLAPFALLLGTWFPAIEANQISTNVTLSSVYTPASERLELRLHGDFRELVRLTLQGSVQHPLGVPRYDLHLQLDGLRGDRLWTTFVHDAVQFPTLARATVAGRLDAALQLTGRAADLDLKGRVNLSDGRLETRAMTLAGVSLALPFSGQYPLPPGAALPAAAYGQLRIDALRLGAVSLDHLDTRLALQSDNLVLQPVLTLSLWGGRIVLAQFTASHLLQGQRRLYGQLQLHNLDLQQLPRGAARLPLAGVVNGDFPMLQIVDGRLTTQGELRLAVAGGVVRLFDLQGRDLFSGWPEVRCSLATEKPLSLTRLTELYPIGGISGSLHFTLTDLLLRGGTAEAFKLDFAVDEKDGEAHQITLRALNNLLFSTGSAKVASGLIGDTQRLPYKYFGVVATLQQDTLRLRGKYHDHQGNEYFMRAPLLGDGVSIVNRVPDNGIPFQDFVRRLKATVLEKPDVRVR